MSLNDENDDPEPMTLSQVVGWILIVFVASGLVIGMLVLVGHMTIPTP